MISIRGLFLQEPGSRLDEGVAEQRAEEGMFRDLIDKQRLTSLELLNLGEQVAGF